MTPTTAHLPLILIRGFAGFDAGEERQVVYQGFNDGTVYPEKRGENYIYEGLVVRYLKSNWRYHDATNVVGYYPSPVLDRLELPPALKTLNPDYFTGNRVVIDPGTALDLITSREDPSRSLWVFRYYDFDDRSFKVYAEALVRLIDFIRDLMALKTGVKTPVNVLAHSMGGLIVREALQVTYPALGRRGEDDINKIVTLGTPHHGVVFQLIRDYNIVDAGDELERFNPAAQADPANPWSVPRLAELFPARRILTVVGTNYRTYSRGLSLLNRLFAAPQERALRYNRSDGLVKQTMAQLPGAPRTFIHKSHGGQDSLITARESFEIATRFFHGDIFARLNLRQARITRGFDWFGKSELFFGVSIKPRRVDFELFHQSAEAENCYGPFHTADLTDDLSTDGSFDWAGPDRLIWEGWFDTSRINPVAAPAAAGSSSAGSRRDIVMRLDIYVGERDTLGIGFSDNVVFRKQYYIRAVSQTDGAAAGFAKPTIYLYRDENFGDTANADELVETGGVWAFRVEGTGFEATLGFTLEMVTP